MSQVQGFLSRLFMSGDPIQLYHKQNKQASGRCWHFYIADKITQF